MIYHYKNGERVDGAHSDLRGDVSDLHGDVSDLRGDVSDISGNVIFVTNVGSRESATYYFYQCDVIICGCFRGNLEKFILRVQKKYPDGKYRKEYDAVIALFETIKETKK